jgi:hypothetical protein
MSHPIVRARPKAQHSQIHGGINGLSPLTHRTQRVQPLPDPLGDPPYHYSLSDNFKSIADQANDVGKLIFHVVGDVGGIKDPEKQINVARQMKTDLNKSVSERPQFFYILGDVVYYNGETDKYYDQFYEPYDHYDAPIFAIPGNHDGDPASPEQKSLDGWVRYFMTMKTHVDALSQDAPRLTQSQPNAYFTFVAPFATIVGLYTNVPEGGSVDSIQQQWFTNEIDKADRQKALIVALHHPVYSFDDHHSGSPRMADILQNAINDTRRIPNMVLTAHVHNYQRVHQKIGDYIVPFIVAGNGGYHHLHGLHSQPGTEAPDTGAVLEYGDAKRWGYLTLSVDGKKILGQTTAIDKEDVLGAADTLDSFDYPTELRQLKDGQSAQL